MAGIIQNGGSTFFAPAKRLDKRLLVARVSELQLQKLLGSLMDAIGEMCMLLTTERQIIAVNAAIKKILSLACDEDAVGLRPGELLNCVNADVGPGGCGTSISCASCGAVNALLESMITPGATAARECRIRTHANAALDVQVCATVVEIAGNNYIFVNIRDISDQKRRNVLERVFFHDLVNSAGGIHGLAEILIDSTDDIDSVKEYAGDIYNLSDQILDDIAQHRELLAAEQGVLEVHETDIPAAKIVQDVVKLYQHHEVSLGKKILSQIQSVDHDLHTDPKLLRRAIGNMIKNALEATPAGGSVSISAKEDSGSVFFAVNNAGVIPENVQQQIFQRSFSTKGEPGRGIGCYSIKLFTERYLGGTADFKSDQANGTTFTVRIPIVPPLNELA